MADISQHDDSACQSCGHDGTCMCGCCYPSDEPAPKRGGVWHLGPHVTLEHDRLGWVVGIEWILGRLYLSFGRYVIIIHKERKQK